MAEGRPLMPRIRMPKVTLPGRASRAASGRTTATKPVSDAGAGHGAGASPTAQAKPGAAAEASPGAAAETRPGAAAEASPGAAAEASPGAAAETRPATAPGGTRPDTSLQERVEGLQGWMAEIERKQARTTYFGAVAVLIAIAAAGVALYFGITNKNDSATKGDVDALKARVDALQSAVTKNSKDTQDTINASITQLQSSIQAVQKQQSQNAASIATLQSQVAAGALNKGGNAAGTTATPGATTTTTPKKP